MRVTRTYLELTDPGQFKPSGRPLAQIAIARVPDAPAELYRECYRTVGAAYHWRDRWDWTDAQIRAHLADPAIAFYTARRGAELAGYYELRRVAEDGSVEVAYFGLVPHEVGNGIGGYLLTRAVEDAWAMAPRRVWLHTCTMDHPHALPNYLARGFRPYKTEVYEVDLPS